MLRRGTTSTLLPLLSTALLLHHWGFHAFKGFFVSTRTAHRTAIALFALSGLTLWLLAWPLLGGIARFRALLLTTLALTALLASLPILVRLIATAAALLVALCWSCRFSAFALAIGAATTLGDLGLANLFLGRALAGLLVALRRALLAAALLLLRLAGPWLLLALRSLLATTLLVLRLAFARWFAG